MYTNVFLIVVLFGAGTDYCLFLISRFREEMADDPVPAVAVRKTTRSVGETIASSAGTVIVGLATMASAELGLFNTSGPSLAIGVAIALLAALTFTPALLTLLGRHTFWPRKAQHRKEGRFWNSWSHRVVRRPVLALVIPVVILVPLAVYGLGLARDFDLLGDLPKSDATRQGFDVLSAHLGPGVMQPINFLALDAKGFDSPAGLAKLEQIQAAVAKVGDVAQVRSFTASLPDKSTLSVASQIDTLSQAVDQGLVQLQQAMTSGSASSALLQTAESGLLDTYAYLTQLAGAYPEVLQDRAYVQSVTALTSLAKLAGVSPGTTGGNGGGGSAGGATTGSGAGGGTTASAPAATSNIVSAQVVPALKQLAGGLSALGQSFAAKPDAQMLPAIYLKNNQGLKGLHDAYVSSDGTAARFQVVLSVGPYTPQALTTVAALRQTLQTVGVSGAVEGTSAVLLDLRDASNRDMTRTIVFVLAGIFVVLLLLLRAIVAPIYLILTILLSYTATLGVVRVLFVNILGAAGLTWWVPIFMFVMLVALGMDYNIFLIGRVKEEAAKRGTREGTQVALAKTGGIITSAGIIMAGTFAAMMSASILGLLQIGFAVAFGVLLDTFVVRTTVVPAIIVLLRRWSWWPRRGPGQVDHLDHPDA
jgi:RND superfamily putative drug exporter